MGLFKPKRDESDQKLSEQFSLTVLDNASAEHQAKLREEVRICPTCFYQIINPMTDRCPRCFSYVELSEHTNCRECDYQGNCALVDLNKS
ncbi:MAG: hypothetical protein J4G05_07165 [Chlorobi bacterium]|nr:hypothetical protein [Chlorobiota bacterium]